MEPKRFNVSLGSNSTMEPVDLGFREWNLDGTIRWETLKSFWENGVPVVLEPVEPTG